MPESLPQKKTGDEETLQFLKREEVRTMAKDVALLREEEAKKERERIAQIKTEGPKKEAQKPLAISQPVQGRKPLSGSERPMPPSLMPHDQVQKPVFVRAKTSSEKIVIRVVVIGVLLFILLNGLAFGYWYFTRKKVVEVTPFPEPTPVVEVQEPVVPLIEPEGSSEPERPPAPTPVVFFETAQEKTVEVATADSLPLLLSNVLKRIPARV